MPSKVYAIYRKALKPFETPKKKMNSLPKLGKVRNFFADLANFLGNGFEVKSISNPITVRRRSKPEKVQIAFAIFLIQNLPKSPLSQLETIPTICWGGYFGNF